MKYDRAANERNAIGSLNFVNQALEWFRLDDGVMGGQSETLHRSLKECESLDFCGTINTDGGGFCSIRANLNEPLPPYTKALKIQYTGDGKTYKLLLSDGTRGSRTPSWQADVPTTPQKKETQTIILESFKPSMGPRPAPAGLQFNANEMQEIGIMLSLKLSDGSPNPVKTFGQGIFPFSLKVHSIEPVLLE